MVLPNERWGGKRSWMSTPQTALILTALLKKYCQFRILDANGKDFSQEKCLEEVTHHAPDVVLVSAISTEYSWQCHKAIEMAKLVSNDIVTVMGGVYPTLLPDAVMKDVNVDYIFLGHAEERVVDFLDGIFESNMNWLADFRGIGYRNWEGKIHINPIDTYIGDVKELVSPDYSLIDLEPYLFARSFNYQTNSMKRSAQVMTSYGCPYDCVFCASRTVNGRKVVYRTVEDVLQEIEFLREAYRIENIVFMDDNFAGKRKRIEKMLNAFIDRNYGITWKISTVAAWHLDEPLLELMKEAGCENLSISVESGSERVLKDIIRKPLKLDIIKPIVRKCRELGISMGANFVIGFPDETWDEIRETFRFAEECDFDVVHFHIATPLPKTDLYVKAKEKGCLPQDFDFLNPKYFGFARGFISTEEFTPEELMILRSYEWDRINFSTPEKVARVAELYCTTVEMLNEHRKQTRRKAGLHF